jgi:phosphohistidine phosphatase
MRHLFLLRHGKSAWPDGVPDHQRPLAPRGMSAVSLIAIALRKLTPGLDRVLVSDARRTRETFARLGESWPELSPLIEPSIYQARPDELLALVRELPEDAERVLMIGHNPGLHALALHLAEAGNSNADALGRLEHKVPTAALIHLEFSGFWRQAGQGQARLADFITPAMLGGADED